MIELCFVTEKSKTIQIRKAEIHIYCHFRLYLAAWSYHSHEMLFHLYEQVLTQSLVFHMLNGPCLQIAQMQLEKDLLKLVYDFLNCDWPLMNWKKKCNYQCKIKIHCYTISTIKYYILIQNKKEGFNFAMWETSGKSWQIFTRFHFGSYTNRKCYGSLLEIVHVRIESKILKAIEIFLHLNYILT